MSVLIIVSLVMTFMGIDISISSWIVYTRWESQQDRKPYISIGIFVFGLIVGTIGFMGIVRELL